MSGEISPPLTSLSLDQVKEEEGSRLQSTFEPSENRLIEALRYLKDQLESLLEWKGIVKDYIVKQTSNNFHSADITNLEKMINDINSMIEEKGGPKAPKANFFVLESLRNVLNVLEMVSIREKLVEDMIETEKCETEKNLKLDALQLVSPYEGNIDQPPKFRSAFTEEEHNSYTKLFIQKLLKKEFDKLTDIYKIEVKNLKYVEQGLPELIRSKFNKFQDSSFVDGRFATALMITTVMKDEFDRNRELKDEWNAEIKNVESAETLRGSLQKWEELREYPNQLQEWTTPPLSNELTAVVEVD
jgi:hypothetical protein